MSIDKKETFPLKMEKSDFDIILGKLIKTKRTEKGLSQSQLAARIGNNFQNISRLERGELSPTLYWCIEYLAPALDLTGAEFVKELENFILNQNHKNAPL